MPTSEPAARSPFARALALGLAATSAVLAGACSLLVDGRLDSIACAAEGTRGPPACPEGWLCKQGSCVDSGGSDLGSLCADHTSCALGDLCLDPADFGGAGAPFCSRPCCSSSDCDPRADFVCAPLPSGGGDFCVQAGAVGRGATGGAMVGDPCQTGADCRSGACEGSRCADVCCSDTNCGLGGLGCSLGATPAAGPATASTTWVCADHGSALDDLAPCGANEECASGLCLVLANQKRCVPPCCGSGQCPLLDDGVDSYTLGCAPAGLDGSLHLACAVVLPATATKLVGAPCDTPDECKGGLCIQTAQGSICSDVCCSDESCGDPTLFACRPFPVGGNAALRCEPR